MNVMLIVASVREGRCGAAVADWVRQQVVADGRFSLDVADLAELQLPLSAEPNHPRQRAYRSEQAKSWSGRVDRSDGFVVVLPEYNHSFSAPLKNALDYLFWEWRDKPIALVSYGGLSGGARAVTALQPVLWNLGLRSIPTNVEIAWVEEQLDESGAFAASDRHLKALTSQLDELAAALSSAP